MHIPILQDIVIIIGLAILVSFVFKLLRIPAIVGFLLTGILAGPYGLGLVKAVKEVEVMAEIGVILLLFTIGLEFSLQKLIRIKKVVLIGGTFQVLFAVVIVAAIGLVYGLTLPQSLFVGFLISLSSTAIVLKMLQERSDLDTPHGRNALGILLFQDVIVVPMMIIIPILGGATKLAEQNFWLIALQALLLIIIILVSARWIIPILLHQVALLRNRELFLLSIVFIAFAVAWITSQFGLSLALGAFLAGLIISESEYSHAAVSNVLPFHDLFMSFFFVSIGMLLDIKFFIANPWICLLLAVCLIIVKFFTAGIASILLRYPLRTAIIAGFALAQIGEFSFILSAVGREHNLITGNEFQIFLAVVVLSMILTPFIFSLSKYAEKIASIIPLPKTLKTGSANIHKDVRANEYSDHLIIVGFGLNGRKLVRAAKVANLKYIIVDMNPDTVRTEQHSGEPIFFGDASQPEVLSKAGIERARIMAVVINDPAAALRITRLAKELNSKLYIIVRSRYLRGSEEFYRLGADEVVVEEFESSVRIFARVLMNYNLG
jgi:CPA2 family monovalent cation:H+ antiporter-2